MKTKLIDYVQNRFAKSRIKYININFDYISFNYFSELILSNLYSKVNYSILFKVKFNGYSYGMLALQRGFRISSNSDYDSVRILYDEFNNNIENFMSRYPVEWIDAIQAMYVSIDNLPSLKLDNINNIYINKDFTKVGLTKYDFSSHVLPLSINTNHFGKLLLGTDLINYLNLINSNREILSWQKYLIQDIDTLHLYNNYIILSRKEVDHIIIREIYHSISGALYTTFKDNIINDNSFNRSNNNTVLTISNDKVTGSYISKDLPVIKYQPKSYKEIANNMIGSLDLETFEDLDGVSKAYAIGFKTLNELSTIFYLDEYENSNKLITNCIDSMIVNQYNGYIFYTHNFGRFDFAFIVKALLDVNENLGYKYYDLEPTYKNNTMFMLKIKILKSRLDKEVVIKDTKGNKSLETGKYKTTGYNSITIVDSYNIVSGKLYDLSVSFDLGTVKSFFPHEFVRKDTINYVGITPSIEFWGDKITEDDYTKVLSNNWDLKKECIKYLDIDLSSLLNIMNFFNKYIFNKYDLQMTDCCTISRLAMNIFVKDYLNNSKLPIVTSNMYNDIKKAYYGGITEVYKPFGKDLFYYDVNSLYPYSSINYLPGNKSIYMEDFSKPGFNINNIFGFFYCEIETDENYLGLLPVRIDTGIIMPNGKWSGWYFSEEIKFAIDKGYNIKIIKGYNFDRQNNVFDKYVNDLYSIKSTSEGAIKQITKSLLNNLIGRFGLDINKPTTEIVNLEKLTLIQSTRMYESLPLKISEDNYLISYYPEVSKHICNTHGVDYIDAYKQSLKYKDIEDKRQFRDVSITTSASITAYARIFMSKVKLDILNKGGNIYYTDTDSIVSDIMLDDTVVGNNLGQFKLEHKVKEGYFIAPKLYCLLNSNNKIIIKSKGGESDSLKLEQFKELYKGNSVEVNKIASSSHLKEGYVRIYKDTINLNPNSYTKRVKVYDNEKWIDTKPINYNQTRHYFINNKYRINIDNRFFKFNSNLKNFIIIIAILLLYSFILMLYAFVLYMYYLDNDLTNSALDSDNNYCINNFSKEVYNNKYKYPNILQKFISMFENTNRYPRYPIKNIDLDFERIIENISKDPNIDYWIKEKIKNSDILSKLRELYYEDIDLQNRTLRDKISWLQIKELEYRIEKLDNERIIKEINNDIMRLGHIHRKISIDLSNEIKSSLSKIDSPKL